MFSQNSSNKTQINSSVKEVDISNIHSKSIEIRSVFRKAFLDFLKMNEGATLRVAPSLKLIYEL